MDRPEFEPIKTKHVKQIKSKHGRANNDEFLNSGSTIFDALVQACSPAARHQRRKGRSNSLRDGEDEKKDELSPHDGAGESLFEKVINCTLITSPDDEDDDSDDEDTFQTRTYEDQSYASDNGESYEESFTEDEDHDHRRSRRRQRV